MPTDAAGRAYTLAQLYRQLGHQLWEAAVLVELDDEEPLFVGEREPRELGVGRPQRFDGI
jgi:hypothetical protein